MVLMADQLADIIRAPRKTTGWVRRQPPHAGRTTIDHRPGQLTTLADGMMMVADAVTTFRTVADHPTCFPAAAGRPRVLRLAAVVQRCFRTVAGSITTCSEAAAGSLTLLGRAATVVVAALSATGHNSRLQWLLVAEHLRAGGTTIEIWTIGMPTVAIHDTVAITLATQRAATEPAAVTWKLMMVLRILLGVQAQAGRIRMRMVVCPLCGMADAMMPSGMVEERLGAETLGRANGAEAVILAVTTTEVAQTMGSTAVTHSQCVLDKVAMMLFRTETLEVAVASGAVAALHPEALPAEEEAVARRLPTSGRKVASEQHCSRGGRHPAPLMPRRQATARALAEEDR